MKCGEGYQMNTPTIFMTACGATQTAAEAIFPSPSTLIEQPDSPIDNPPPPEGVRNNGLISVETGYALIVGINCYSKISNLNGCINDAIDNRAQLIRLGLDPNRILLLLDEEATKSDILSGIQWLVSHCNESDSLWFIFSGHGSWALTKDGQGWECCFCCQDCDLDDFDNGIITRSEFIYALERPSGNLTVMLDSCFSGGMTPNYPAQKILPEVVYEILYKSIPAGKYSSSLRAVTGPEWLTKLQARERLKLSSDEIIRLIRNGSLQTRKVINGPEYVRV